jgi:hypothetical protein
MKTPLCPKWAVAHHSHRYHVNDFYIVHRWNAANQLFNQCLWFGAAWLDVHSHAGVEVTNRIVSRPEFQQIFCFPGHRFPFQAVALMISISISASAFS